MIKFKYGDYTIEPINSEASSVPTSAQEITIDKTDKNALAIAINSNIATLLIGETGTGKSGAIKYLAYKRQQPYARVNMNGYTTPDELIGRMAVKNGATYFEHGVITKAMTEGAILVLDEVNGTTQDCLFVLHGLLDDDKQITLPNGEVVRPHKDFRLFATCNPDYEGTKTMNKAFVDRFGIILFVDTLTPAKEKTLLVKRGKISEELADNLVTIATMARKDYAEQKITTYISTRALLNIASLISKGLKPIEAYASTIEHKTTNKDEQRALHDFFLAVMKQGENINDDSVPTIVTKGELKQWAEQQKKHEGDLQEAFGKLTELQVISDNNETSLDNTTKRLEESTKELKKELKANIELKAQVESYKRLDDIIKRASKAVAA